MRRPRHLPEQFWIPVEAAWAKGTAALLVAKPSSHKMKRELSIELVIKPVVITFAENLCEPGRAGVYSMEQIHRDLDELRRALSIELCPEPRRQSDWFESFDREARNAIVKSHEWRAHLEEQAAVVEQLLAKAIHAPDQAIAEAATLEAQQDPTGAEVQPTPSVDGGVKGPLQERAAWLQRQLTDRGWSLRHFHEVGGPHWTTTQKILDGYPVTETVLRRVVQVLNPGRGQAVGRHERYPQ